MSEKRPSEPCEKVLAIFATKCAIGVYRPQISAYCKMKNLLTMQCKKLLTVARKILLTLLCKKVLDIYTARRDLSIRTSRTAISAWLLAPVACANERMDGFSENKHRSESKRHKFSAECPGIT